MPFLLLALLVGGGLGVVAWNENKRKTEGAWALLLGATWIKQEDTSIPPHILTHARNILTKGSKAEYETGGGVKVYYFQDDMPLDNQGMFRFWWRLSPNPSGGGWDIAYTRDGAVKL